MIILHSGSFFDIISHIGKFHYKNEGVRMLRDNKVIALIPAAGMGVRMGNGTKKQFLKLGALEILNWTLLKLWQSDVIDEIIVIVPASDIDEVTVKILKWQEQIQTSKTTKVVLGGETRQASVYEGLKCVSDDFQIVVVHDGVRPFVPVELLEEMCHHLMHYEGAVVATRSTDTLKQVDESGVVIGTINRELVWSVQTPQVFKFETLLKAHAFGRKHGILATDDANLIEHIGGKVLVVENKKNNLKITTPFDLYVAEAILNAQGEE